MIDGTPQDLEPEIRLMARRNKLLGLWAAERMGYVGEQAQRYARDVVASDFQEPGEEDVVRKLMADFASRNARIDEQRLRTKMDELLQQARTELGMAP